MRSFYAQLTINPAQKTAVFFKVISNSFYDPTTYLWNSFEIKSHSRYSILRDIEDKKAE